MRNPAPFKQGGVNNFNNQTIKWIHRQPLPQIFQKKTLWMRCFNGKINSSGALGPEMLRSFLRENKGSYKMLGRWWTPVLDSRMFQDGSQGSIEVAEWFSKFNGDWFTCLPQSGTCWYEALCSSNIFQPLESLKWKITKPHSLVVSGRSTAVKASGLRAGESCSRAKRRCNLGHLGGSSHLAEI